MNRAYRRLAIKSEADKNLFGSSERDRSNYTKPYRLSRKKYEAIRARSLLTKTNSKCQEDHLKEKALARKQKILSLEKLKKQRDKDDIGVDSARAELEEEFKNKDEGILSKAKFLQEEAIDEVKIMRQKMLYAKCAQIRAKQIQDRENEKEREEVISKKLDQEMEAARVEKIRQEELIASKKKLQQRKDLETIQEQLQEKEKQRQIEEDILDQERKALKEMIISQEIEAKEKHKQKIIAGKTLLKQVLDANSKAIRRKQEEKQREIEEDAKILQWQHEKRLQEEDIEKEKILMQKKKDRDFYEVAAKVKKCADTRAEEDAARARKHQLEEWQKQKSRENREKQRQQDIVDDLAKARVVQLERKEKTLIEQKEQEMKEWKRIGKQKAEEEAKLIATEKQKQKVNKSHQERLILQIREREQLKLRKRLELIQQGSKIKDENIRFENIVKRKKKEILQEMKDQNIPSKYCADVARMKITS